MIHLVNFADNRFRKQQQNSSKCAIVYGGVDVIHEFSPEDIDNEFKNSNSDIFKYERGVGLWLWKPYIVSRILNELSDGEYIVYSDAGVGFIRNVNLLIEVMLRDNVNVMFFGLPMLDVEWTKKEAFDIAGYSPKMSDRQVDGSFFILKVSDEARNIVREWLDLCSNEKALSPTVFDSTAISYPSFVSHREDQSLLSIILHKRGVEYYRDPSDYGEFPFQYKNNNWTYSPQLYMNSQYPTVILHHRSILYNRYLRCYRIKKLLSKVKLWNETIFSLKNKIK